MTYLHGSEVKVIPDFPKYAIMSNGRVFNRNSGRELVWSPTQNGDYTVGLVRSGIQHRRSVKVLVAEAFVPGRTKIFDTPIQIDGNKFNLDARNIVWRPRWFAWEYTHQFNKFESWYNAGPILDVTNNLAYENIFQAALATASLCKHIHAAIISGTHVFPGGEKYVYI